MTKRIYIIVGIIVGVIVGYLIYPYVSCLSGTCPLTSNQSFVAIFGGFVGYVLADSIYDLVKKLKK